MDRRDFLKGFGLAPIALIPGAVAKSEEQREEYVITFVEAREIAIQVNQDGFKSYIYRKTPTGWKPLSGMDVSVKNKTSGKPVLGVVKYVHDSRYPETELEVYEQVGPHYRGDAVIIKVKMKDLGLWWIEGEEWLT
jgi:hypothetical protein